MTEEREPVMGARDPITEDREDSTGLAGRVGDLVEGVVGAGADVVGGAVGAARSAANRWDERPGSRVRRLRRLARQPLPYLYDLHPDARQANPRELGIKTIDADLIAGTAVGGATQRGGDFLPLKAFRSVNWQGRWQRIRAAVDRLAVLPPIDVLRFADRFWVLDGHNRVAAALYAGQIQVDANVVELVPPDGQPSERPGDLAAVLSESRALRNAGEGRAGGQFRDDASIDPSAESS